METKLCVYGCGKLATHQLKNGKWICSSSANKCSSMKNKNSIGSIGKSKTPMINGEHPKPMLGKIPWNFGKTKETNRSLNEASKKLTGRINLFGGRASTPRKENERRDKIRKSIQKRYEEGWMPKAGRCKKIHYHSNICGDVLVDGNWELDTAKFLDRSNMNWERNKKRFAYLDDGKQRHYTPDFYLKDKDAYLEVKGYETELDRKKWNRFPHNLYIFKKREIDLIRKCEFPRWEVCLLNKMTT
jgi:hypothetical protein